MKKVLFISSDGGHLDELMKLGFEKYDYKIVTEKTEYNESLSEKYGENIEFLRYGTRKNLFKYIFIFFNNICKSYRILKKFNPEVIVSTGTHTAIPMCFLAKLHKKKVVWIETFANKNTKTLAGKIIYKFTDVFIVQWEEMLKLYPKAKFLGPIY